VVGRFTILALALAIATQADTLRLTNGSRVTGTFLGGTADYIRFLVGDDIRHYSRADVVAIDFGSANPPSRDSDAPPKIDLGPDYANAPYMRGANGYLPLEREVAMPARGGGMYGGGGTVYRIQGARSPVRARQGDRIEFVVRFNRNSVGDARQFQLFRLESRMGFRQTQPSMGGGPPSLPVRINQIGDNMYEIIPSRALYPGEYAISSTNSNESYCFGVDY